jgi:phosphoribosylformimino-5-aminoimidazole carboxamide ribotide isomerase
MRFIPVVDILNGVAVHAFAGQRHLYRPVQSVLADTNDPAALISAIARRYPVQECYVADIDRIQGRPLNTRIIQEISDSGMEVMLEAGIRNADDVNDLPSHGILRVVVGSETITHIDVLKQLLDSVGPDRLVFSIDLQQGELLTSNTDWLDTSPFEVFQQVLETGIRNFILLDLVSIGTGGGVTTRDLYQQIRNASPTASVVIGGGIRTVRDVRQLLEAGVDGVLMASAFHNGSVSPQQLQSLLMTPTGKSDT